MMKEIIQSLKLLKCGYQVKTNIVCACLFCALGIAFMLIGHEFTLGTVYIYIANMFATQTMYMLLFSSCVAASPKRKKIELRYIDIMNIIGGVLGSVLILVMAFCTSPAEQAGVSIESMLVISGLMAVILYCYMSTAFKSMIIGTILFFFFYTGIMVLGGRMIKLNAMLTNALEGKRVLVIVIFLAENILGIVCAHGIRKLLYRKSMSKMATGMKLRMELS